MTLYEINTAIMACIDPETGEIQEKMFDQLNMERDKKIENIAVWSKNLKAEAEAIKAEEAALAERRKAKENKAKSLEKYLSSYLDGQKWESPRAKISFRKSTRVEVEEGTKLPEAYISYGKPKPNKDALKRAILSGAEIDGVKLEEHLSIGIK